MRCRHPFDSLRFGGWLRIAGALALLVGLAPNINSVVRADDDDEPIVVIGDDEEWSDPAVELIDAFNSLAACCHDDSAREATYDSLMATLLDQLSRVEWICDLTSSQNQKLLLAGRGDIQHLLHKIAALRRRIEALPYKVEEDTLRQLIDETARFQNQLEISPFGDISLFTKILHATLTAEQRESYEALCKLAGGDDGWDAVSNHAEPGWPGFRLRVDEDPEENLAILSRLKTLRSLTLEGPFVPDEVLPQLGVLAHLEQLDLRHTVITDDSLWYFPSLTSLQCLRLDGSLVTGAGCEHLKALTHLTDLSLADTEVGDDDLAHLKFLPNLRKLNLAATRVSNAGLIHLRALTDLEWLDLTNTDVTNAGLNELKKIKSLSTLKCSQTEVTDSGVALLKRWRPGVKVER